MAFSRNKFTTELTTGFGEKSSGKGGRFFQKNGQPNVRTKGIPFFGRFSWFHTLISMPISKFFLSLFAVYLIINLLFAGIYLLIGVEHLIGVNKSSPFENFLEALFFSAQTLTTVGYGRISPSGFAASFVASAEAFTGVLSFALASGLFYGRFSRPRSFLKFSDVAVIAPYKEGIAFMFRTVPYKNNHLIEAEVKLTLAMQIETDNGYKNQFYTLPVEFSKINSLALNWTIVHAIDENSPMYGLNVEELKKGNAEIMVFIKAFDEVFSNTVVARSSYTVDEMIFGAKFKPMYFFEKESNTTILNISLLNAVERVALPEVIPSVSE